MDSKILRRALLTVTLFVAIVFIIILMVNGVFDKSTKSHATIASEQSDGPIADKDGRIIDSDLDAWKYDETFFDENLIGGGKYNNTKGEPVVLSASSVEKDLRIRIAGANGKLVKGKQFAVTVGGTIEAVDEDMDGVIHVSNLKPGDYEILLSETPGYIVPTEPMTCTVKAKVEYKAIDDISYLIKTEADIDASKEDTAVNDAAEESSGNSAVKTVDGAKFGIDVSKYNGLIDWNKVKNAGVEFAIVRCGYRGSSTGTIVVDPYFNTNMEKATLAGVPLGVYFFTQATNTVEAVEEASAVVELIKSYNLEYPVFIDTEGAGGHGRADNLEVIDRSFIVQTFCETIRSAGYTAGIYASKNWFNKKLDITKLSADNVTWLAEYNDKPSYGGTYQMWQYSSAGSIDGIEGRVDMNLSYLDMNSSVLE